MCGTTFGSFPCFSKDNAKMDKIAESTYDKALDLGSILYFKMLKNQILLLVVLTIINLPLLLLNANWGTSSNSERASNFFYSLFFKTTLGSFGDYQTEQNENRARIQLITLITDVTVLVVFAFNIFFLEFSIKREKERIDVGNYQLNDFGVQIGNIPGSIQKKTLAEVKITITDYVRKIIE